MSALELWISQNIWTFLIVGLLLALGLLWMGARSFLRARRRMRGGAGSWRGAIGPLALLALGAIGLSYFGAGSVVMGPELLGQRRLLGQSAPEVRFARVSDGTEATLGEHRGKVVLLNQWATWCPPCRHELPDLDKLQTTYGERGLVVLQISDEPREVLEKFLAASPMSTEHGFVAEMPLPDPGRPTTYVIDRQGVVRRVIIGPRSFEQFEAEIGRHL